MHSLWKAHYEEIDIYKLESDNVVENYDEVKVMELYHLI